MIRLVFAFVTAVFIGGGDCSLKLDRALQSFSLRLLAGNQSHPFYGWSFTQLHYLLPTVLYFLKLKKLPFN